ncbi:hypothetical protein N7517_004693 [Penicillium concentricum]|uniref:Uncharacterized protein n=1 Tax=Penicillium concentricum TaxID=293559 RepID=A0A9W9V8I2_9EURO|nr:uncharacterized protein N7517_004693 [Penicillium concentricum]KAJ5372687.1 hypothetical protein N7517_004693 [Penicillium concentricum]
MGSWVALSKLFTSRYEELGNAAAYPDLITPGTSACSVVDYPLEAQESSERLSNDLYSTFTIHSTISKS